jgi:hypothetical protein
MAQVKGVKEVVQVPKAKAGPQLGSKPKGEFLDPSCIISPR